MIIIYTLDRQVLLALDIGMNGQRLREAREKAHHTQESLSEVIMINKRMLTRYENGETDPSADVLARIADALGVSSDYLLGLTDDPSPHNQAGLSIEEQTVVSAMRRGDMLAAIRVIVSRSN